MTIRFPALLEDADGSVIEYGTAELASDPNSVNFIGGFIPLYRIGEKVTVVRIYKDKRLESLKGEVFLSSRNLLRVTGIDDMAMENIWRIFYSNAQLKVQPYISVKRKLKSLADRIVYQAEATIYYLSGTEIKLLSIDPLKYGQQYALDLDDPFSVRGMLFEVRGIVDFGNIMNAYLCRIVNIPDQSAKSYGEYLKSLLDEGED